MEVPAAHNGLAHFAEFRRPDGTWVVVRDNLENRGFYYAAFKSRCEDPYPKAIRTNLFGGAMPAAGNLPDGRSWILCNTEPRFDFFLTLSDDGVTFDRTWEVLHIERESDGGMCKGGGPQYPQAVTVGDNIWLAYSITKEKEGITRVPLSALPRP